MRMPWLLALSLLLPLLQHVPAAAQSQRGSSVVREGPIDHDV